MAPHQIYYHLKPYLPLSLRLAVRRAFAWRKRRQSQDLWPINPTAGRKPDGWNGWPEGKQFAFVLTHDVEGPSGLAKCRQLMKLEMELGFRSSFNFIPEGPYSVTKELRDELTANGFEVGVHDLNHDGKLYKNREDFQNKAERINGHLKDWGATGFRSGFMLRNLDWLHDLEIGYDASTFDTDPFEPQPDGAGTIFPFWVPHPNSPNPNPNHTPNLNLSAMGSTGASPVPSGALTGNSQPDLRPQTSDLGKSRERCSDSHTFDVERSMLDVGCSQNSPPLRSGERAGVRCASGFDVELSPTTSNPKLKTNNLKEGYVELPYTLPQDSTLFLIFQERHPDIWFQKLDWIAAQGGMALLNVHPDYIQFEGEPSSARTYPVELYARFLKRVRDGFSGKYWHVLPRDIARHVSQLQSLPVRRRPLRVCMVTHSHYARDNRVIRYAESLAARGDEVDVLNLRASPDAPARERIGGVNVFCLQDRFGKKGESALGYLWPILRFFFRASAWMTRRHNEQPYDVCHIHNIPDFLIFAAWYPRLRGAKLILDIHDVVPEFFASKFSKQEKATPARSLLLMERWSARFAHRIIIANDLWLEKYATRTGANGKCSVFINNVDTEVFRPLPRTRKDDKFVLIFPGGLQWHQGLDIAIRAFHKIAPKLPKAEFHIYGDGNMKNSLMTLTEDLGLGEKVRFFKPRPIREIADIMANADLGIVPKRADSFGNEAYSTKIMEFMAVGVPAVISSTKIDRYYFDDSVVKFFESGNEDALAQAILDVQEKSSRETLVRNASAYVRRNSWETRSRDYLNLVDSLVSKS